MIITPPFGFRFAAQPAAQPPTAPKAWWRDNAGRYDAVSGGSIVTVDGGAIARWEDQSGNGHHLTQSDVAERPTYDATRNFLLSEIPNNHYYDAPATLTFDRRNFSFFFICALTNLRQGLTPAGGLGGNHIFGRSTGDSCNFYSPGSSSSGDAWKLTVFNSSTKPIGIVPYTTDLCLIGFVGRTTGCEGWVRNQSVSIAALTSGTSTMQSLLGWTSNVNSLQANVRDILFYDRALTTTEINDTLIPYAVSRGMPAGPSKQIVFIGDSITHGYRQTKNQNWPSRLVNVGNVYKRVTAESSITLQTLNSHTARDISLFRAGERNVAVIFAGTNDIALTGATGTTTHTRFNTECTALRGAGYKVIAVKMIARNFNATQQGYRNDFNALVDSNWTTYADAIFDPMAYNANFGTQTSSLFDADQIHLSNAGAAAFAEGIQPVIEGQL